MTSWELSYKFGQTPWNRPDLNPAFVQWQAAGAFGLLYGARILVPGAGTSPEPLAFARLGAEVTAVDVAKTAIRKQTSAFTAHRVGAELILGDVLSYRDSTPFDLIYEQTCLCALPVRDRAAYENMAFEVLKPGGRLFVLFMQTDRGGGPPFHCDLAEMRQLFPANRWGWPLDEPLRSDHPLGVYELGFVLVRSGSLEPGAAA